MNNSDLLCRFLVSFTEIIYEQCFKYSERLRWMTIAFWFLASGSLLPVHSFIIRKIFGFHFFLPAFSSRPTPLSIPFQRILMCRFHWGAISLNLHSLSQGLVTFNIFITDCLSLKADSFYSKSKEYNVLQTYIKCFTYIVSLKWLWYCTPWHPPGFFGYIIISHRFLRLIVKSTAYAFYWILRLRLAYQHRTRKTNIHFYLTKSYHL